MSLCSGQVRHYYQHPVDPHRAPVAESASEVSPDQGVEGEVADLPDEELLGVEEQVDAGEVDELVADLEIGNLLLGLVEIIKFGTNKYLQLELVGDASLSPWIVHRTLVK